MESMLQYHRRRGTKSRLFNLLDLNGVHLVGFATIDASQTRPNRFFLSQAVCSCQLHPLARRNVTSDPFVFTLQRFANVNPIVSALPTPASTSTNQHSCWRPPAMVSPTTQQTLLSIALTALILSCVVAGIVFIYEYESRRERRRAIAMQAPPLLHQTMASNCLTTAPEWTSPC